MFQAIVEKFTHRELGDLLSRHGKPKGKGKPKRLKNAKALLKSDDGPTAIPTVLAIQKTTCPVDLKKQNEINALAAKLTNELDTTPMVNYNDQGQMDEPSTSNRTAFGAALKLACNGKLNLIKDSAIFSKAWQSIGKNGQQKWTDLRMHLINLKSEHVENGGGQFLSLVSDFLFQKRLLRHCLAINPKLQ